MGVLLDEVGGAAQVLALQQAGTMLLGNNNDVRSPSIAERLGLDVLNYGYASNTGVDGIQESIRCSAGISLFVRLHIDTDGKLCVAGG